MGHSCGHENGLLTTSRDTWHKYIAPAPVPEIKPFEKHGIVWTTNSVVPQCIWFGRYGRCIYEIGHTLPHKDLLSVIAVGQL
jgi:hypothetical protein